MSEQLKARPKWMTGTRLAAAALPEPPLVQKYRGGQSAACEEEYERAVSDAALESLATAGTTLVWVRFYGGFGLEFEKAEMERSRDVIARAHKRGLKAGAAVQFGLAVPETLLLEEPDCHHWLQVNAAGQHPPVAGAGAAGVRSCYNCEGFLRYLERVCLLAVDAGAGLVRLDNVAYNPEPDTCRCPTCVAVFRELLRRQYGAQDEKTRLAGLARFGHNTFSYVRPPAMSQFDPGKEVTSPHEQEWIKFKVETLSACLSRLSRAVSRRNPECGLAADLLRRDGDDSERREGVSATAHLPLVDLATSPPELAGGGNAGTVPGP